MLDVGDLPVLTFGNSVLKAEWLSELWNYTYVFYVFLQNPKKHDLIFTFLSCCHAYVFSNTKSLFRAMYLENDRWWLNRVKLAFHDTDILAMMSASWNAGFT